MLSEVNMHESPGDQTKETGPEKNYHFHSDERAKAPEETA